jgi:NTE family protein
MAESGEGPVIAVDVTNRVETAGEPTLKETLWRTVTLGSIDTALAAQQHADLVIAPGDDGVGLLEFHQIDTMREAGRRAAREALAQAPDHLWH